MSNPLLSASCLVSSETLNDSTSKTSEQVFRRKAMLARKISGNLARQSPVFVHSCSRWYASGENTVCCLQSALELLHLIPSKSLSVHHQLSRDAVCVEKIHLVHKLKVHKYFKSACRSVSEVVVIDWQKCLGVGCILIIWHQG